MALRRTDLEDVPSAAVRAELLEESEKLQKTLKESFDRYRAHRESATVASQIVLTREMEIKTRFGEIQAELRHYVESRDDAVRESFTEMGRYVEGREEAIRESIAELRHYVESRDDAVRESFTERFERIERRLDDPKTRKSDGTAGSA